VGLATSSFSHGLYHLIHSNRIALRVTVGVVVVKTDGRGVCRDEWLFVTVLNRSIPESETGEA